MTAWHLRLDEAVTPDRGHDLTDHLEAAIVNGRLDTHIGSPVWLRYSLISPSDRLIFTAQFDANDRIALPTGHKLDTREPVEVP